MKKSITLPLATAIAIAAVPAAFAQDDSALLNKLVQKGILTQKEAQEVRTEMKHDEEASPLSKLKINDSVTELKLYGDLRLRYQYDDRDLQVDPAAAGGTIAHDNQRSRARFRLRLGTELKLGPNWFAGAELSTNQASDSGNQTFDGGFSKYGIYISKAYLGWKNDWLTLEAGKFSNPFYTTDLVWDPDINPNGVAEVIAFHKLFATPGSPGETGYGKDGKSIAPVAPGVPPWELTLVAGQLAFSDNPDSGDKTFPLDTDRHTDVYLFETQLIASYRFDMGVKATIAPAWLVYNAGTLHDLNNENLFQDSVDNLAVSGGSRNLSLLLAPGDVSFSVAGVKTKFFWDFAYNTQGKSRAEDIYRLTTAVVQPDGSTKIISKHNSEDDFAYQVGVQLGENKKAGDWSLLASWRQTGIAAVDPNLNDSDFALGELNTRGVKLSLAYSPTSYTEARVTYMYAWNLRDNLFGGEATGGNAIGDANNVQVLQVDLGVKF